MQDQDVDVRTRASKAWTVRPGTLQASVTTAMAGAGIDRAFQHQLQHLYSDVMSEPVPQDLLDLVMLLDHAHTSEGRSCR